MKIRRLLVILITLLVLVPTLLISTFLALRYNNKAQLLIENASQYTPQELDTLAVKEAHLLAAHFLGLTILSTAIIILVSLYVIKRLTKPLTGMKSSIEKFLEGDYSKRYYNSSNSELGEISRGFNKLVDRLISQKEELRQSMEQYRIVLYKSGDVIVEWIFATDVIVYSYQWFEKFGYEGDSSFGFCENEGKQGTYYADNNIHPDDSMHFIAWLKNTFRSTEDTEAEFRIRRVDGSYLWVKAKSTPAFDNKGEAFKAIILLEDIDFSKQMLLNYISKSQRDTLTGLYNKGTTEALIDEAACSVNEDALHALYIIDIDNFKGINDNLGHMFGDAVLTTVASKLKGLFRATDVVGRIGGDEFIVFLRDVPNEELIIKKATDISNIFRQTIERDGTIYKISGSIGISILPSHGKSFAELYKKSDIALYTAKKMGKDCFAFYSEATEDKT